ncbi:hypothetical protein ACTFIW_011274 [Dictyostelium discoideum]
MNIYKENSIIFFKLWRNIVIKNKIIEFLRLYNFYYFPVSFDTVSSFLEFQNKEYLNSIKFSFKGNVFITNENNNFFQSFLEPQKINYGGGGGGGGGGRISGDEYLKNRIDNKSNLSNQIFKEISNIPNDITLEITTHNEFLDTFVFPKNIKTLIINLFGFKFDFSLENYKYLKHLIIKKGFYTINSIFYSNSLLESVTIFHEGKSLDYTNKINENNKIIELPKTLKLLKLSYEYHNYINFSNSQLKRLSYSFESPQMINVGTLPNTLETLLLNSKYHFQFFENVLPKSLTHLEFDNCSNFSHEFTENVLPPNLKTLKLPRYYNETLKNLPKTLTSLKSGRIFPKSILFELTSLIKLDLSNCIDLSKNKLNINNNNYGDDEKLKTLENILPYSLRVLHLTTYSVISPITIVSDENKNYNLTKLIIPTFNRESLKKIVIPKSIKSIDLNIYDEHDYLQSFYEFNSLESLRLGLTPSLITENQLPKYLKDLRIYRLDLPFNSKHTLKSNILPTTLKYLKIFSFQIQNFINFVKKIKYNSKNNNQENKKEEKEQQQEEEEKEILDIKLIDYKLPSSIKILEICSRTDVYENWLPESIEILILPDSYSKIHLPLPSTLHSIYIDSGNHQILNDHQLVSSLMGILKPIDYCSKIYKKLINKQIKLK